MEVDIRLKEKDTAVLVYHPHIKQRVSKKPMAVDREGVVGEDELGQSPEDDPLVRQHSGGSVTVGEGEGEMSTEEAIQRRNDLRLPPLAAVFTIEVKGETVGLVRQVSRSTW